MPYRLARTAKADWKPLLAFADHILLTTRSELRSDILGKAANLKLLIHFADGDVKRLGRHGVGVCHCPTSNMVLASGQCRTRELEAAGWEIPRAGEEVRL